jgi:hypothetical protein
MPRTPLRQAAVLRQTLKRSTEFHHVLSCSFPPAGHVDYAMRSRRCFGSRHHRRRGCKDPDVLGRRRQSWLPFVGVRSGTERRDKSAGEFSPKGEDRRDHRLHLGRAKSQESPSRSTSKRPLDALTKLRIERGRVVRRRKQKTAVRRQARYQSKVGQDLATALRMVRGAADDTWK